MPGAPLLLEPRNGLANRLRVLDAGIALARAQGREISLDWLLHDELGAPFETLLEPSPEIVRITTWRLDRRLDRMRRRLRHARWRLRGARRIGHAAIQPWLVDDVDPLGVLPASQRVIVKTWMRFYAAEPGFRWLRPAPAVADRFAEAQAHLGPAPLVGVHIRRGDHALAIERTPTEAFFERMDKLLAEAPRTRFLVASDAPDVEAAARQRFGSRRVVALAKRARDRVSVEAVQDALVDLLALSACSQVLGTFASTFGKTAAELGGVPYEVVATGARWSPGDGPMRDPPTTSWLVARGQPGGRYDGVRR
ncbi:MAG: hypothetical protein AB7T63_12915 [Planctomycetota bacterium]